MQTIFEGHGPLVAVYGLAILASHTTVSWAKTCRQRPSYNPKRFTRSACATPARHTIREMDATAVGDSASPPPTRHPVLLFPPRVQQLAHIVCVIIRRNWTGRHPPTQRTPAPERYGAESLGGASYKQQALLAIVYALYLRGACGGLSKLYYSYSPTGRNINDCIREP